MTPADMTPSAESKPESRLRKTYPLLVILVLEICFAAYLVAG